MKAELLAPAGTLENFEIAVQAGADAVYIGAPGLNARALARHFSTAEIAAMIDYGHQAGVKVYMAMNSLMKEDEIPQAVELLAILEGLRPDALIIQDLGLYSLIKKYFPSLTIHASTLMAAHNSLSVRQFARMGFSRVVLAREMTLAEIKIIHRADPVELEVFVHGALCFSYSGLCLFSSYCGGKSGLRGHCVQPCRRRYTWAGSGKGHRSGYFFSMNDLNSIDVIPQLIKAGVSSLKIEGRMRSGNYVDPVVRAYRLMIDSGSDKKVLAEARQLLETAMGRKGTSGYFFTAQPEDGISPYHSGNIGLFLGKINRARGPWANVTLKETVQCGDRLRLHGEKSGERDSFTVKGIRQGGKVLDEAQNGMVVELECPGLSPRSGDSLYKVDVKKRSRSQLKGRIKPRLFNKKIARLNNSSKVDKILRQLGDGRRPVMAPRPKKKKFKSERREKSIPLWLKVDEPRLISQLLALKTDKVLVTLDQPGYQRFRRMKRGRVWPRKLIWVLPPIILEDDLDFYKGAVTSLRQDGYHAWQIGHIGQLQLFFADGKKDGRLILYGDYTLNVMNSLALAVLKDAGLGRVQAAIESDRVNLDGLCRRKRGVGLGLTVYGRPPLFTARLDADHFQYDRPFVSPRGEKFVLKQKWNQTLALPMQTFSLLDSLADLARLGIDYGVLDLSFQRVSAREISRLIGGRTHAKKSRKLASFNYHGRLK